MILTLCLLALVAVAAWKSLVWVYLNLDRVRDAGGRLVRVMLAMAYVAAIIALPVWAYAHPADGRSGWIWVVYLVGPVLALAAFGLLSARKRGAVLPIRL